MLGSPDPLSYTNWKDGQPNNGAGNGEEDCVITLVNPLGKWQDESCARSWPCYTCECTKGYIGDGSTCKGMINGCKLYLITYVKCLAGSITTTTTTKTTSTTMPTVTITTTTRKPKPTLNTYTLVDNVWLRVKCEAHDLDIAIAGCAWSRGTLAKITSQTMNDWVSLKICSGLIFSIGWMFDK